MSKSVKKGLFTHEHHGVTTGPTEYAHTVWVFTFLRLTALYGCKAYWTGLGADS